MKHSLNPLFIFRPLQIILVSILTLPAVAQSDIILENTDGVFFKNNLGVTDDTKIFRRSGNALSIQYDLNTLRIDAIGDRAMIIKNSLEETKIQFHPNGNSYFNSGSLGIGLSGSAIDEDYRLHVRRGNQALIKIENTGTGSGAIAFANATALQSRFQFSNTGGFDFQKYDGTAFNSMMKLTNSGRLGIGTTNPSTLIEVESNNNPAITINNKKQSSAWSIGESYGEVLFSSDDGSGLGAGARAYIKSITHSATGAHGTLIFGTRNASGLNEKMRITHNSRVGIGTTQPDEMLTVKGKIHSEEVKVDLSVPGPDYVFEADYDLRSLTETEAYIRANKHLPEIPSAKEMEENGVQLGEMNMLLLKKIEELTLYTIQQQKQLEIQQKLIEELKSKIED